MFSEKQVDPQKETIFYCGGGVTACIGLSVAEDLGFEDVKLYDGSWADYSSTDKTKNV